MEVPLATMHRSGPGAIAESFSERVCEFGDDDRRDNSGSTKLLPRPPGRGPG